MMTKRGKRWDEMTQGQRAGVVVLGAVQVTLLGAALIDLRRRPAAQVRGSKKLWSGLVFVNFLGPIAYFLVGRRRTA